LQESLDNRVIPDVVRGLVQERLVLLFIEDIGFLLFASGALNRMGRVGGKDAVLFQKRKELADRC
jgi:hypothetical protein